MRSTDSQKPSLLESDLLAYLTTLGLETSQSHERVLKKTQHEQTVVIEAKSPQTGTVSQVIKKEYSDATALAPYETLLQAQNSGTAFSHLPRVISVCDTPAFVLLSWQPGVSLRTLSETRTFSTEEAYAIMQEIAAGLDELHTQGPAPIIHRDLTPSNILYDERTGQTSIIDLGIARTWNKEATQDTQKLGTPIYAAPEQYGYSQTSEQTDIFAAGMVFFFLLAGQDPTPQDIQNGFLCIVEKNARTIIQKATAFDPKQRYQSANELLAALKHPSRATYATQTKSSSRFFSVKALWNLLLATAVLFLLIVCVWLVFYPTEPLVKYSKITLAVSMLCVLPLVVVGTSMLLVIPSGLPQTLRTHVPKKFCMRFLFFIGCLCCALIVFTITAAFCR